MRVSALMKEYFDSQAQAESRAGKQLLPESFGSLSAELPVAPESTDWSLQYDPERLHRTYIFDSISQRSLFVEELMSLEEVSSHHAKITIEGLKVTVEVWTHDVERVTELDQEYAADCDVLYKDISLIGFNNEY